VCFSTRESSTSSTHSHSHCIAQDQRVIDWLRNKSGIKVKTGALAGKRQDYFKGKHAIKALLSPNYLKLGANNVPRQPETKEQAREYLHSLIPFTYYLRIQLGPTISPSVKAIQINPQQLFQPEEYYVWLIDKNPIKQLFFAACMVLVVLAGVMFPLWPIKMRIGVWYLSVGVLGLIALFFGLAIIRLFLWVLTKLTASPGIWLFPNLFADVGFVDSFIPLWSWDLPPRPSTSSKKKKNKDKASSSSSSKEKKSSSSSKKRRGGGDATSDKVDVQQAVGGQETDSDHDHNHDQESEAAKIIESTPDQAGIHDDDEDDSD
jgi:translocation protein SEC62